MHADSITRNLPRMRAGFLKAIRRERRRCAGDARILRALAEKERLTRRAYVCHSPWYRFRAALRGGRGHDESIAIREMTRLVPPGATFALVDGNEWAVEDVVAGRPCVRWYNPTDDDSAILELAGLRRAGVAFLVIASPGFWWLGFYSELSRELRARFPCLLQNHRLVVFELRPGAVSARRAVSPAVVDVQS